MLLVRLIFLDLRLGACGQVAKLRGSEGGLTSQRSAVLLMHSALTLEGVMSQQFLDSEEYQEQSQLGFPPLQGSVAAYLSSKVGYFSSSARRRTTGRFLMTGSAIETE